MEPKSTMMENGITDKCTAKESSNGLMGHGMMANLFMAKSKAWVNLVFQMAIYMKAIGLLESRKELVLYSIKITNN